MTGADIRRRREALQLPLDSIAIALGEHSDQVAQWESIPGALPRQLGRRIDWVLAIHERDATLLAMGAAPCPIVVAMRDALPDEPSPEAFQQVLARAEAHGKDCPACQRREAALKSLPELPLPPLPLWIGLFSGLSDAIERWPAPLRPAAWGAIGVGLLTAARALLSLVFQPEARSLTTLWLVLGAVAVGAYGGAVGGIVFHLVRGPFRRFGRAGDYLTGIAIMYGYLLAILVPLALWSDEAMLRTPLGWGIMLALGTFFGLVIGHAWFREPRKAADGP
jgi:hypothetical protein